MSELKPGATIGILGGGQLGRMLSVAASRLGYRCHVYEPGAAPAGDVAHRLTTAPYEDTAALDAAVQACFESADYAEGRRAFLEKRKPMFQGR